MARLYKIGHTGRPMYGNEFIAVSQRMQRNEAPRNGRPTNIEQASNLLISVLKKKVFTKLESEDMWTTMYSSAAEYRYFVDYEKDYKQDLFLVHGYIERKEGNQTSYPNVFNDTAKTEEEAKRIVNNQKKEYERIIEFLNAQE